MISWLVLAPKKAGCSNEKIKADVVPLQPARCSQSLEVERVSVGSTV